MRKNLLIQIAVLFLGVGLASGKVLDTLIIEGVENSRPAVLRNAVALRKGAPFSPSDVQESLRRLYKMGHFRSVDFLIAEETDSSASLVLRVEEFPVCESIEFLGNRKIKAKELEEGLGIQPEQTISDLQLHKSKLKLSEMYAEKGYLLAQIEIDLIETSMPGRSILKYTIEEGARVRIKEITFSGNEEVNDKTLKRRFKTKENRWYRSGQFDKALYRSHLDSLVLYYNEQGYLDAEIAQDSVWYSDSKTDIFIDITVNEGTRYYVGDIFFTGNSVVDSDSLSANVSLRKGRPFQRSRFEMTKFMVENAYREEGYLWVRVDDQRTFRGDTVDMVMDIFEGRPAIIRRIDIMGNSKTMEKVVRREIELVPGQRYRQSQMVRSQQNIFRLNYFDNVMPDLSPNDDGTIDLVFNITEKDNIGQLTVGAAYSGEDQLTGTFATAIPNFRGAGQELKVDLQYGKRRQTVTLGMTEPWAFDTPWWLTGTVFYDKYTYEYLESTGSSQDTLLESSPVQSERLVTDDSKSYGFRTGIGRSRLTWPDDKFRVNAVYQLSREQSSYESFSPPGLNMEVLESGYLSRLTFNIERYDFDMPLFPNTGSRLTIRPEIAGVGARTIEGISDVVRGENEKDKVKKEDFYQYFKGTVVYEHYFQLPWKLVLGTESKFGVISGLGNDIRISRLDLFSAGGVYSDGTIRGYPEYSFGGRYERDGDGIAMFTSTLQLRYPLIDQQIYLALFADVGNTWSSISNIDFTDLYRGVGFGIRVNVPMLGLMGFDFGWGLDDPRKEYFNEKPSGFEIHFIMNKGF